MKKSVILLLLMALLIITAGCRKTTDEDIYGNKDTAAESGQEENTTEDSTAQTQVDPTEEGQEDGAAGGDSETPGEGDDGTVSDEVYDSDNATQVVDDEDVDVTAVATSLEDPEFEASLTAFLDPIYYNIFFGHGDFTEGISQDDMIKFAVSYIYQHEYNELKFDTTDFILYVPEKRVEALVEKYFDVSLKRHHSFIDDNLMYEDGFYLMPAVDTGWGEKLSIGKVTPTGDFSYDVLMERFYEGDQE